MKAIDLTGHVFGRLTVLKKSPRTKPGQQYWVCRCQCGNIRINASYDLRNGLVQSCRCARTEQTKIRSTIHGKTRTREWNAWHNMKARCCYPSLRSYKDYGARGITVCDRWLNSFQNFLDDMGECPDHHSLDRIDTNGNYEPSNCRWADQTIQRTNKRETKYATLNGETKPLLEWCKILNLRYKTIVARIDDYNWPPEEALTTPIFSRRKQPS